MSATLKKDLEEGKGRLAEVIICDHVLVVSNFRLS